MDPLYKTRATASHGGRDGGLARTSDGRLEVKLVVPPELGGTAKDGTDPEQLFATGYAGCFASSLNRAASLNGERIEDSRVTAEVSLIRGSGEARFALEVSLKVYLPGMDAVTAESIVKRAEKICPYSNAIRGNVAVETTIETS